MAGLTRLVCHLLLAAIVPLASAGTKRVLLWAAARFPEDPTAETLAQIDANQDGHIDPSEVSAFAQSEGLDMNTAMEDFSGIDTNGDGTLDPAELIQVLGNGAQGAGNATVQVATSKPKPIFLGAERELAPANPPVASEAPHAVSVPGRAAEAHIGIQAMAKNSTKHKAHIGIQGDRQTPRIPLNTSTNVQHLETQSAQNLASQHAKAPQATDVAKPSPVEPAADVAKPSPVEPAAANMSAAKPVAAKPSADIAKPSPVERMVKHFAQVLRTAEVVPARAETFSDAFNAKGASTADIDSRATVQSAAKEVSEQLSIAETAEAKARVLDRKAAEELANATVLAKLTTQEALNAGAAAAHAKAAELLARISKLEDQAERADVRSAALHSKAKLETDEASELMAVADRALNHAPKQPL